MRLKSILSFCLTLTLCLVAIPAVPCRTAGSPDCSASSAILCHPASGTVLYEKNADERRPIASTTKIMTALTVLRAGTDLDRAVTVPASAVGIEGSSLWLKAGETLTLRDLLYGLLLASANDAAAALAVLSAGSVPAFADRMNAVAKELGLGDSHFVNPHGLDNPEHYSTARDLSKIAAAALEDETFREIVSTKRYTIPSPDGGRRFLCNHNKLLSFFPDCVGVKTGFTKKSGRCLVSAAERDGDLLICVTLNDPNDWRDHSALLDYGFSLMESRPILAPGELTLELPVVNGERPSVTVENVEEITLRLPKNAATPEREILLPRFLPAPLAQGEIVGRVVYRLNGKTVGESPLAAKDGVPEIKYKRGLFHR